MDDKPGSRFFDTSYVIYQQFVHDKLWTSADDFRRVKGGHTDEQKKHKLGIKLKPTKVKTKTTKETKKRLSNTIKDPDRNSVLLVDIENIRKSGDCEKLLISENVISSFLPNNDVVEVIETVDNVGSSVETSVATLVETSVATLVETSVEKILQPSVETKVTIVEEIKENIEEILPETSNRNDITVSAIIHRPNSIGKDSQLSDDLTTNNNINNNLEIVHQIDEIIELRETNVPELNELKLELNEDSTSNRSTITEEIITTLLINENELNLNENPKVNLSRSTSISDKSVTGTELSVNIKRKQYERRSTDTTDDCDDSSFDESDDPVYEQVKIGNGKNYDGNQTIPKSQSFPISSHQQKVTETLRLHYVTERILSSVLPPRSQQNDEQQSFIDDNNIVVYEDKYERELINMLEQKHGKNYRLFDLESCISTITLEKLCELCKHIDSWLGSGREKVVVLQDRGDRQRLGAAIAAYLEYQKICGSNFPRQKPHINEDQRAQSAISRNWLDLDIFSMQKFLEDVAGPLRVPSHKRYLTYFSGLLSGNIKMNSSPLHLKFVSLESPPSWLHYDSLSSQSAEWKSFIKIYEGLNCVFTSDIHVIPISTRQFIYEVGHLRLRGDVTIRCYQIVPYDGHHKTYQGERELMFSAQFHTCAVTEKEISFKRNDLDFACDDPRFPLDHKVTMNFGNSKSEVNKLVIQSPLIRIEPATSLARWDSLENLKEGSSHTQGPLDGSLYATITKNSKSPQSSPTSSDIQNLNDNNNILVTTTTTTTTSTPIKPIRISSNTSSSTSYNVISPPPEFRNTKLGGTGEGGGVGGSSDQIVDNRYTRSISVPVHTNNNSVNNNNINNNNNNINNNNNNNINNYQVREIITKNSTSSYQSPPPTYEEILIQPISKLTSKEPIYSSKLQTQNSLTGTTSNNQYSSNTLQKFQDSGRYTNPTTATTPINNNNNNNSYQNNQIRIVETTTTTTSGGGVEGTGTNRYNNNNNNNNNAIENGVGNYQGDGRESVRSPLTLSMDSGISSSGVNRRTQGSSVSPSSFPSQASPQEDRHRELDDILSDMLMTVQDIPDYGNNNNNNIINNNHINTINKSQSLTKIQNKNNLPTSSVSSLASSQFDTNTIKRSQSYTLREESILLNSSNNNNNNKDRDIYDTSSTTTTLTPPPSESGRETPTPSQIDDQHIYNEKRRDNEVEEIINMDLQQNQSYIYPQTGRTEITLVSEDEDNIPYHAREYSRPFTYGNVPQSPQYPPSGVMLKMQSGLSSPSLVRKQLGNNTITTTTTTTTSQHNNINKKTPPRNDFEEMFRERREKVLNEKYSISDKTNGLNLNNNNNNNNNISGIYDYKKSSPSPSAYTTTNNSENNKWFNTTQTSKTTSSTNNGYGYHEPLKRSNTMDGGFGRSTSTDGISGQTWLQLQQQKLRAKKELQLKEDRDQYDRIIRTEIHTLQNNRPVRSRSSASNRYDGYVSDTAAFNNDEIDYRRPLHVQTPHTPNRASERNYHTLTTTTVTSNERPFVAVKRGHEQAIHGINSSSPTSPLSVLNASPNGQIAHAQNQQNGLLSFVDGNSPRNGHGRLVREESFSSYRSETEPETSPIGGSRPETPAFPVTPRTPYGIGNSSPALPPKSPTSQRKDLYAGNQTIQHHNIINHNQIQNQNDSCYTSRRNSTTSNTNSEPQDVAPQHVKFVRDSSKFWYRPTISRDEAVSLLRNAHPGTFIVRDSTTFANAYGLVIKVAHPPPGVAPKGPPGDELVRHFLVEPTTRGVRLKGCANEPVFTSLSALVYQHSITPLALPCKLIIPERQEMEYNVSQTQEQFYDQGAACNVLYLYSCETESLTGPQAVRKAVSLLFARRPLPTPTQVHFKVSRQGVTLTDNTRQLFFRKHYSANHITFCGLDPDGHMWSVPTGGETPVANFTIFAFVAKRSPSTGDNQCHVFCQLEPNQPAAAIVSYAHRVIPNSAQPVATKSI